MGQMSMKAQLSPIWKPHRVLSGSWAKIHRAGWLATGWPKASAPGTMDNSFRKAVIVAMQIRKPEKPRAEVYFILPSI